MGLANPFKSNGIEIISGCNAGHKMLNIFQDGNILPCPRINISLGNSNVDSIIKVFEDNDFKKLLIDRSLYSKCSNCEIGDFCRGCIGLPYNLYGNIHANNPLCWRGKENDIK